MTEPSLSAADAALRERITELSVHIPLLEVCAVRCNERTRG